MDHALQWLDGAWGVVLLTVVLLLALGWYLSYLAARLDRLHHRVETSRAALETRLARRAAVALEVSRNLAPPAGEQLRLAASRMVRAPDAPVSEAGENLLARALHQAFADRKQVTRLRADPATGELLDELVLAGERVQLARRFHNDAVAHAQRMRRKKVVRWAKLAGTAQMPQMVEIDDSQPESLAWQPPPQGGLA
ncbi:hypothetical protein [Kineosporia sp. NBRC 101731]|uniref:hypothetical protein n=1 Tax=Kineosporia sp. NBRC 101731 TaxID=3032199 RepID=UPI0024A324B3|nr:hypothetical protein [Kineosporia sp. NBRC 101731]GLY30551.1 membrane protein [Kineosporia sp. NBRC 101731]